MEEDLPSQLDAANSKFALDTIQHRWPVIIAQTIDSLYRHRVYLHENEGIDVEKLKSLTGLLGQLRYEVMTNKPITLLSSTLSSCPRDDLHQWNRLLEQNAVMLTSVGDDPTIASGQPTWYTLPWLLTECYLYRRIADLVALSGLDTFDPFAMKKRSGFTTSVVAVQQFLSFLSESLTSDETQIGIFFKTLLQAALWANEFDLSLHVDEARPASSVATYLPTHIQQMSDRLVVNDTAAVFDIWMNRLREWRGRDLPTQHITAIVLDNTGPEMLADLCFAEFLIHHRLTDQVQFHPKCIPWYVSDVTPSDFDWLLNCALTSDPFGTEPHIMWATNFRERFEAGQFVIRRSNFWTLPCTYRELRSTDSALHDELLSANVVVFKGDLNYRKIVADRRWIPDSVSHKLKAFAPLQLGRLSASGSVCPCTCPPPVQSSPVGDPVDCRCTVVGPLIIALRVAKSDVAVGLTASTLRQVLDHSEDWWTIGRYGLVQVVSPVKFD